MRWDEYQALPWCPSIPPPRKYQHCSLVPPFLLGLVPVADADIAAFLSPAANLKVSVCGEKLVRVLVNKHMK